MSLRITLYVDVNVLLQIDTTSKSNYIHRLICNTLRYYLILKLINSIYYLKINCHGDINLQQKTLAVENILY